LSLPASSVGNRSCLLVFDGDLFVRGRICSPLAGEVISIGLLRYRGRVVAAAASAGGTAPSPFLADDRDKGGTRAWGAKASGGAFTLEDGTRAGALRRAYNRRLRSFIGRFLTWSFDGIGLGFGVGLTAVGHHRVDRDVDRRKYAGRGAVGNRLVVHRRRVVNLLRLVVHGRPGLAAVSRIVGIEGVPMALVPVVLVDNPSQSVDNRRSRSYPCSTHDRHVDRIAEPLLDAGVLEIFLTGMSEVAVDAKPTVVHASSVVHRRHRPTALRHPVLRESTLREELTCLGIKPIPRAARWISPGVLLRWSGVTSWNFDDRLGRSFHFRLGQLGVLGDDRRDGLDLGRQFGNFGSHVIGHRDRRELGKAMINDNRQDGDVDLTTTGSGDGGLVRLLGTVPEETMDTGIGASPALIEAKM
jgi:hypothetical protein